MSDVTEQHAIRLVGELTQESQALFTTPPPTGHPVMLKDTLIEKTAEFQLFIERYVESSSSRRLPHSRGQLLVWELFERLLKTPWSLKLMIYNAKHNPMLLAQPVIGWLYATTDNILPCRVPVSRGDHLDHFKGLWQRYHSNMLQLVCLHNVFARWELTIVFICSKPAYHILKSTV